MSFYTFFINYYTAITVIAWLTLAVLCVLVYENDRIHVSDKIFFYLAYALIALSALAEWSAVQIDGRADIPAWHLMVAKCADYILTPMAGAAFASQMRIYNKWYKMLLAVLGFNTVFQLIAAFNGWMVVIDENNHYSHGPLYGVYIAIYLIVITLIIIEFVNYGNTFRRQNRTSLYAIMMLIIAGIAIQEMLGREFRTAYITLAIGAALMFIHYTEFTQLNADDFISEQQKMLDTDSLTGLLSRNAYSSMLRSYAEAGEIPPKFAAFSIDINGLKETNDTLGHEAGDELICGAAKAIKASFAKKGKCYRTGGDEFIVIAEMDRPTAEKMMKRLQLQADGWTGSRVKELHLAAGYALAVDHPGAGAEAVIRESDVAMYAAKDRYYEERGLGRRSR